jgi:hypothetical protein
MGDISAAKQARRTSVTIIRIPDAEDPIADRRGGARHCRRILPEISTWCWAVFDLRAFGKMPRALPSTLSRVCLDWRQQSEATFCRKLTFVAC